MYVAARLIATGRRLKLAFGYGCPIVAVFRRLYGRLAAPSALTVTHGLRRRCA